MFAIEGGNFIYRDAEYLSYLNGEARVFCVACFESCVGLLAEGFFWPQEGPYLLSKCYLAELELFSASLK